MIDVPHNLSSGEYSVGDATATKAEIAQNRFAIAFAADAAAEYGMSRAHLRSFAARSTPRRRSAA